MNREILFKAKRIDNGEWVEGLPGYDMSGDIKELEVCKKSGDCRIWEIDPDTLCQYIGLTDKNGNKIWENDIVKCDKRKEGYDLYKVVWRKDFADFGIEPIKPKFEARYPIGLSECDTIYGYDYKVIGNIFDNPELFGG